MIETTDKQTAPRVAVTGAGAMHILVDVRKVGAGLTSLLAYLRICTGCLAAHR